MRSFLMRKSAADFEALVPLDASELRPGGEPGGEARFERYMYRGRAADSITA
jgi:hypothetical protein